jgi:hypothetical protein
MVRSKEVGKGKLLKDLKINQQCWLLRAYESTFATGQEWSAEERERKVYEYALLEVKACGEKTGSFYSVIDDKYWTPTTYADTPESVKLDALYFLLTDLIGWNEQAPPQPPRTEEASQVGEVGGESSFSGPGY